MAAAGGPPRPLVAIFDPTLPHLVPHAKVIRIVWWTFHGTPHAILHYNWLATSWIIHASYTLPHFGPLCFIVAGPSIALNAATFGPPCYL